jgi:hypothetical protein
MVKYLRISHLLLCSCSILNILIYEENLIFFLISACFSLVACTTREIWDPYSFPTIGYSSGQDDLKMQTDSKDL